LPPFHCPPRLPNARTHIPAQAGRSEEGLGNNPVRTNPTAVFRDFPNQADVMCTTLEQPITAAAESATFGRTSQVVRSFAPQSKMDVAHPLNGVPGMRQSARSTTGPNRGS
jgi:hypothetical protein